ncbi:hypothetical protein [Falsiroseomonas sp. CW058]|uniref:hypothetical protein n=1 Tax=Falsiroseomonas sp. CW058 TaxID=3388664 RepID=UPI003D3177D3
MNDDTHDDGLVHSHGWATEPPPSVGRLLRPADGDPAIATPDIAAAMSVKQDHDDGLVHGHGWACADRGRMRHA